MKLSTKLFLGFVLLLVCSNLAISQANAEETAVINGDISYDLKVGKGWVLGGAKINSITNVSSTYATYRLQGSLAFCNKAFNPKNSKGLKCSIVAMTYNLGELSPGQTVTNIQMSTQGKRKVKAGTYNVAMLLTDERRTGVYDYLNFKKKVTIR